MERREILESKLAFLTELYQYREYETYLLNNTKCAQELLELFHKNGLFHDLSLGNVPTMVNNKDAFLFGSYNRSGLDYIFFKNYDDGSIYLSNFFGGTILRGLVTTIVEVEESLAALVEGLAKFNDKLGIAYKKHRIKAVMCMLEGKDYFDFDESSRESKNEVYNLFRTFITKLDEYYDENPFDNYPKIVAKRFKGKKDEIKEETIQTFFEVDVDFLKRINKERDIELVKDVYRKELEKLGFDDSFLDLECTDRYFVYSQTEIFDPKEYLKMGIAELSREILNIDIELTSEALASLNILEPIKKIFRSIGVEVPTREDSKMKK